MSEINKADEKDKLKQTKKINYEKDELDEFMTALENAGILTGWSKFMGRTEACKDCLLNRNCPCGYSAGNAACLTVRQQYAEGMTTMSDAMYRKAMEEGDAYQDEMDGIAEQYEMESSE